MSDITKNEYWDEIIKIAAILVKDEMSTKENNPEAREAAKDRILDSLSEVIHFHKWIDIPIFRRVSEYHLLDIISHSDNYDYMIENYASVVLAESLKNGGLNQLHRDIAFWCMHEDVKNALEKAFNDFPVMA